MRETLSNEELEQLRMLSVLYVEDEEAIREELVRFLARRMKSVHVAANGQEGLELYRQHHPDVVVADATMPVMNGLAMARAIKEENNDVPIILTTAHNEHDFLVESVKVGIDSYMHKPINANLLLHNILRNAQPILRGRIVDYQNKLIRFVLDQTTDPTVVVHGSTPEIVNKAFLESTGYQTEEDFRHCLEEGDVCQVDNGTPQEKDCFDYFSHHEAALRQARLFNRRRNQETPCEVRHNSFPDLDTHILSFHPLRPAED